MKLILLDVKKDGTFIKKIASISRDYVPRKEDLVMYDSKTYNVRSVLYDMDETETVLVEMVRKE